MKYILRILLISILILSCCSSPKKTNIDTVDTLLAVGADTTLDLPNMVYEQEELRQTSKSAKSSAKYKMTSKNSVEVSEAPSIKYIPEIYSPKPNVTINNTINRNIGLVAYHIPDSMELGKCYDIFIRINRNTKDNDISKNVKAVVSVIKVSEKMEVNLIDPNPNKVFEIVKLNSDKQFVDTLDYTEWKYNVCPIKNGKYCLNLVISIIIDDTKKEIVYTNNVIIKNNEIVKISTFWEKYWQWLLSTLIIPIFVILWKKFISKNKD